MFLFTLFGLSEKMTYLAIGGAALVVLILLVIFIMTIKRGKKSSPVQSKPAISSSNQKPHDFSKPATESVSQENTSVTEESFEEIPIVEEVPEKTRYAGKYVVFGDGEFYRFRLKASNGEPIVISEPYTTIQGAKTGIETVKNNLDSGKLDIVEDKHGMFHFVLISKTGRVLLQSANYKTEQSAVNASKSFMKFAYTDTVEEEKINKSTHSAAELVNVNIEEEANGKFVIISTGDEYNYQLKASNGRVICFSQDYKTLNSCKTALNNFRELAYTGSFYIFKDKNNNYQFKLYNAQNRLVMAGEVYKTKQACLSVIESIKRFARQAQVITEHHTK